MSVLKSDPKIPKSRDRRQNLVATTIILAVAAATSAGTSVLGSTVSVSVEI